MAKNNYSRRRETSDFSNRRLPVSYKNTFRPSPVTHLGFSSLREFEDRRDWHPQGVTRPARSFSTPRHRLIEFSEPTRWQSKGGFLLPQNYPVVSKTPPGQSVGFARPNRVLICVRRQQRREVLHALDRTQGRGASSRNNWSEYSSVRCK